MSKFNISKPFLKYVLLGVLVGTGSYLLGNFSNTFTPYEMLYFVIDFGVAAGILFIILITRYSFDDGKLVEKILDIHKVSLRSQIILVMLPGVWVWPLYRIKKLKKGFLLLLGAGILTLVPQMILPFPYSYGPILGIIFPFIVYFIYKWSKQWNEELSQSSTQQ